MTEWFGLEGAFKEGNMGANVLTNNSMGEGSLGGVGVNVFEMGLNISTNETREF